MRIDWTIDRQDLDRVRTIVTASTESLFVASRIKDNVAPECLPVFERGAFWRVMLGCLLTTQQRSGPDSSVTRFLRRRPFCPALDECGVETVEALVVNELTKFGGIRRGKTIAEQVRDNLIWLNTGGWPQIERQFGRLLAQRSRQPRTEDTAEEKRAADLLSNSLAGFGPKQSRNLWQWLGLTRYEIPLDRRITRWLNDIFPFKISAPPLADSSYYDFVMQGVHLLCARAEVLPCVLDAAIFASYDRDWAEGELE
jgi:hypothetical protein